MISSLALAQESTVPAMALEDCIRVALEHSPRLVASQQSVVVAEAGLRQARSSYSPQLTLSASDGFQGSSGGLVGTGAQSSGAVDLTLGMTVWRTTRRDSVDQSRASLGAATSSFADQRLALAKLVADDYYAVLAAAELVGVASAGVQYAEQHQTQVRRQIEEGTVADVEIHTVDDDLAQAQLSLITARSAVRTALATPKADMGAPYRTDLRLAPAIMGAEESVPAEVAAVELALGTRPDLQSQRATVEARRYGLGIARADRGPTVEVAGQATQGYSDWSDRRSDWNLTAGLTWPLADGGNTAAAQRAAEAELRRSEAELRRSEAELQSLSDQATLEVQSALIELEAATEKIRATEDALTAATARLRGAEVKYREGLGILIEVTQARQALTGAQADNVRARFSYQVARVALQRAMGTLPLPDQVAEEIRP
jgi:outer membrane protein TolC